MISLQPDLWKNKSTKQDVLSLHLAPVMGGLTRSLVSLFETFVIPTLLYLDSHWIIIWHPQVFSGWNRKTNPWDLKVSLQHKYSRWAHRESQNSYSQTWLPWAQRAELVPRCFVLYLLKMCMRSVLCNSVVHLNNTLAPTTVQKTQQTPPMPFEKQNLIF